MIPYLLILYERSLSYRNEELGKTIFFPEVIFGVKNDTLEFEAA